MIDHFSFEGSIQLKVNDKFFEKELHGKVEDSENGKERRLRIVFDTSNLNEERNFEILKNYMKLNQFSSHCSISVSMTADKGYYISSLDCRLCWSEKDSIIFLMQDDIVSTNSIGEFPDFTRLEFSGLKFRLESNKNIRKILTKHTHFEAIFGTYSETGNQYSRNIVVNFYKPKKLEECKKIIKAIVQSRTIIDGFQNHEADIILLQDNQDITFNYLSRRQVDKFRWFDDSRLNVIYPDDYAEIIMLLLSFYDRQDNKAIETMLNICEYLHQPNYSLPTSRFLEIITTFEGYAKQFINPSNSSCDEKWPSLCKDLKNSIRCSDYKKQEKRKMLRRVKIINPNEEKLKQYLREILIVYFNTINSVYDDDYYNELLGAIVDVRNRLVHNPAEYFDGRLLVGDQIINTICLLRELIIISLLTQTSGLATSNLMEVLRNAAALRRFIDCKLDLLKKNVESTYILESTMNE